MPKKISNSPVNSFARSSINDENRDQKLNKTTDKSSSMDSTGNSTGRAKRKCVLDQEKKKSVLDFGSEDEIIEIPVQPKKEHVAGRGRGRPPLNKENNLFYVFTTRLINVATQTLREVPTTSSIVNFHKSCHFANGFITHESVKVIVDGIMRNRAIQHQNMPPISVIPLNQSHQIREKIPNHFFNQLNPLKRDQNVQATINNQQWQPMPNTHIPIPDPSFSHQQLSTSMMNSNDFRQLQACPQFVSYDGMNPPLQNIASYEFRPELIINYDNRHVPCLPHNSMYSQNQLKNVKDEQNYPTSYISTEQIQQQHQHTRLQ